MSNGFKPKNQHITHLKNAFTWANDQSYSKRRKVGTFIVKDGQVLSQGHNGTISGFDNDPEVMDGTVTYNKHVIHAEANAIDKMAKSTSSTVGATIYCTDTPCGECAKRIANIGIKDLYFAREYHDPTGIDLLLSTPIDLYHVDMETEEIRKLDLFDSSFFNGNQGNPDILVTRDIKELFRGQFVNYVNMRERLNGGYWGGSVYAYDINLKHDVQFMLKSHGEYTNYDLDTKIAIVLNTVTLDGVNVIRPFLQIIEPQYKDEYINLDDIEYLRISPLTPEEIRQKPYIIRSY